jgi:protein tyrosine phosphatase (PTP) superfamily phosphohydrolase (DUF442 family)
MTNEPSPRRIPWKAIAIGLVVILIGIKVIKEGRWYVLPKRFVAVEPDLYRSGQMEAWPYDRVVREHGLKTVLRLNPMLAGDPRLAVEAEVVERHGLKFIEIPMQNGSGIVEFDDLERAAKILAEAERPILFHCSGGSRRSTAVQVVYRLRHCGWTWDQVMVELEEQRLIPLRKGAKLLTHLQAYRDAKRPALGEPSPAKTAAPEPKGEAVPEGKSAPQERTSK